MQETRLLAGGLRMDGHVGPGVLKIGFVRSKEIRVLGACVKDSVMAVACGGSRLNFSANLPGSLLTLLFDPEAAQRVVPESALAALTQRLDGEGGCATLLHSVTRTGSLLEKQVGRLLTLAERGEDVAPDAAEILATSARLIEELAATPPPPPPGPTCRRRELALTVERLLWEGPETAGFRRFSLDDAAKRLKCSRRSIQLALQEEFGVGFVALKRSIRLQQVHAILRHGAKGAAGVGRIAKAHEFNHLGRFAGHYRDMFGILPSFALAEGAGVV
ncbi:MAG: helix-turn-helix domain-containing protein [Methylocystis sp.]|uniref:helix-turn-helix domain-containing protein n=1 Tax=Methylocystis sp. TaxID=1911079 RepID=UPI003DA2000F